MSTIPLGRRDLTATWLAGALVRAGRLAPGTSITCTSRRIGADRGFTGELALVRWRALGHDGGGTLVAKFPDASVNYERCAREVRFYETLADRVDLPVPAVIHAETDADAQRVVLLMETIRGRGGDVLTGCSEDAARRIVERLARMHARWWQHEELDQHAWLPRWGRGEAGVERPHRRRAERFQRRIEPFLKRFGYATAPELARLIESLPDRLEDLLAEIAHLPATLIHADLHLDNIIFVETPDGAGFVLLDWQSVSAGPGLYDVARLLIESLDAPDPPRAAVAVAGHYVRALRAGGIDPGSDEAVQRDLRRILLTVLAGFVSGYGGRPPGSLVPREIAIIELALSERGIGGMAHDFGLRTSDF